MPGTESVRVVVRVRPLNQSELTRGCQSIIDVDRSANQVSIYHNRATQPKTFAFDAVYEPDSEQQIIYDETGFPLVENVLEGYNGTIFAYGQTGCGKTFTMSGTPEKPGVIPNSFKHIFGAISDTDSNKMFLVYCSYIEIYNEEIRDLLRYDPKMKLELKEDKDHGVYIKSVTKESVNNIQDINRFMEAGASHRTTKETMMNERSSRSHSIFTVYVEMSEVLEDGSHLRAGKLNLVDLAGSERQKKTQATGDRLKEAIETNLSLSALGNVISALVDGQSTHIPYRDSKLTRLLQDSLGGNTKTIMIAVASPADYNYDESLSTLRYASRAKFIQNIPKINEDPKDALLREYLEQITTLKRMLAERGGAGEPVVVEKVVERIVEKRVEVKVPVYIESGDAQGSSTIKRHASKKTISDEGTSGDSSNQGSARTKVRGEAERKGGTLRKVKAVLEDDEESSDEASNQRGEKRGEMKLVQRDVGDSDEELHPVASAVPAKGASQKGKDARDEEEARTPGSTVAKTGKSKAPPKTRELDDSEPKIVGRAGKAPVVAKGRDDYPPEETKSPGPRSQKQVVRAAKLLDDSEDEEEVGRPVPKQSGSSKSKESTQSKAVPSSPKVGGSKPAVSDSDNGDYSEDFPEEDDVRDGKRKSEIASKGKRGETEETEKGSKLGKTHGKAEEKGGSKPSRNKGQKSKGKVEELLTKAENAEAGRMREESKQGVGRTEEGRQGVEGRQGGRAEEGRQGLEGRQGGRTEEGRQGVEGRQGGRTEEGRQGVEGRQGGRTEEGKQGVEGRQGGRTEEGKQGVEGRQGGRTEEGKQGVEGRQGGKTGEGKHGAPGPLRGEEGKHGRSREAASLAGPLPGPPSFGAPLEDDSSDDQYGDDFESDLPGPAKTSQRPQKKSESHAIQLSTKRPKGSLQPQQSKSQEEFEDYGDDFEDEAEERRAALLPSESAGRMAPMRGGRSEPVRESKEAMKDSKPGGEGSKNKRPGESTGPAKKATKNHQKKVPEDLPEEQPRAKARKPTVKDHLDLSSSENELEESVEEKEARVRVIGQKVMKGGQTQDLEELNRLKQYHREQLKRQRAAQAQLKPDKKKTEEEHLLSDHHYASIQEEVENQRHIVKGLQLKYKSAMSEIQDLNHEHEIEKEDLLNAIRSKDRESNFLYQVLEKLISTDQLNMIKQKSKFDDENNEWRVPAFLVQTNKPLTFPKLPRRQAQELVEADVKGRVVKFQDEEEDDAGLRNARFQDWKKGDERKRGESQPSMDERGVPGGGMKAVALDPLEQAPVVVLPEPGGKNTPQSRKRLQPISDPSRPMMASDEFPKAGKRSYIS